MKKMYFLGFVLILCVVAAEAQDACEHKLPASMAQEGFRLGSRAEMAFGEIMLSCCDLKKNSKLIVSIAADPLILPNGNVVLKVCHPSSDVLKNSLTYHIYDPVAADLHRIEALYFEEYCAAPSFQNQYMAFWRVAKSEDLEKSKCDAGLAYMFGYILDLQKKKIVAVGSVGCSKAETDCSVLPAPAWDKNTVTFASESVAGTLKLQAPAQKTTP